MNFPYLNTFLWNDALYKFPVYYKKITTCFLSRPLQSFKPVHWHVCPFSQNHLLNSTVYLVLKQLNKLLFAFC